MISFELINGKVKITDNSEIMYVDTSLAVISAQDANYITITSLLTYPQSNGYNLLWREVTPTGATRNDVINYLALNFFNTLSDIPQHNILNGRDIYPSHPASSVSISGMSNRLIGLTDVNSALLRLDNFNLTQDEITMNPTGTTLRNFFNLTQNTGIYSLSSINTDNDGSINIGEIKGVIRESINGNALFFTLPSQKIDVSLFIADKVNWLYIDYTNGNIQYRVTIDKNDIDNSTKIEIAQIFIDGETEYTLTYLDIYNYNINNHIRLIEQRGFTRVSGMILSEIGERYLNTSAGIAYYGERRYNIIERNTSTVDTFELLYRNGLNGWTEEVNTKLNGLYYDDGTGTKATLPDDTYGVYFLFMCPNSDLYVIMGNTGYTTLDNARAASIPALLPDYIIKQCIPTYQIIIKKGSTNWDEIDSLFTTTYTSAIPPTHNLLASLQGGLGVTEMYHLNYANYNEVLTLQQTYYKLSDNVFSSRESYLTGSTHSTIISSDYSSIVETNLNVGGNVIVGGGYNKIINDNLNDEYSTIVGSFGSIIRNGREAIILAGSGNLIYNNNATLNANRIYIPMNISGSTAISISDVTATTSYCLYVDNINIRGNIVSNHLNQLLTGYTNLDTFNNHTGNTNNPHNTTLTQLSGVSLTVFNANTANTYTKSECETLFVNATGDTMTGYLDLKSTLTVTGITTLIGKTYFNSAIVLNSINTLMPIITGNQNNYFISGLTTSNVVLLSANANRNISGIDSTGILNGQTVIIVNNSVGNANITLQADNAGSIAANRFYTAVNTVLSGSAAYTSVKLMYLTSIPGWIVIN